MVDSFVIKDPSGIVSIPIEGWSAVAAFYAFLNVHRAHGHTVAEVEPGQGDVLLSAHVEAAEGKGKGWFHEGPVVLHRVVTAPTETTVMVRMTDIHGFQED